MSRRLRSPKCGPMQNMYWGRGWGRIGMPSECRLCGLCQQRRDQCQGNSQLSQPSVMSGDETGVVKCPRRYRCFIGMEKRLDRLKVQLCVRERVFPRLNGSERLVGRWWSCNGQRVLQKKEPRVWLQPISEVHKLLAEFYIIHNVVENGDGDDQIEGGQRCHNLCRTRLLQCSMLKCRSHVFVIANDAPTLIDQQPGKVARACTKI